MLENTFELIALLLICISPSLAFIGVNFRYFSTKQVINTIMICLFCFAVFSPLVFFSNPIFFNVFLSFLFYILSEKFISSFCKSNFSKCIFLITFVSINLILYYFFGYLPLVTLFFIYIVFVLFDIKKNYKLPKTGIYFSQENKTKKEKVADKNKILNLEQKNDIFIILLESMYGKRGLEQLLNTNFNEFFEYLKDNKFTVYDNILSNANHTVASINSILQMSPFFSEMETTSSKPIEILLENDYELQVFDSMLYPFRRIVPHASYFNLQPSKKSNFLLALATPFFTQSKFTNKLVNSIDPFSDTLSEGNIIKNLQERLSLKYTKPQCYFIRIGAGHSPLYGYDFKQKDNWSKTYLELYEKGIDGLKELLELIENYSPNSIRSLFGDHGATSLRWGYVGKSEDINENIVQNGLTQEQLTLDYSDILFAYKFPKPYKVDNSSLSPCNIFKNIFRYLNNFNETSSNNYIYKFSQNYTFISSYLIGIDGKPLEKWKNLSQSELVELMNENNDLSRLSVDEYMDKIKLYQNTNLFDKKSFMISTALTSFPEDIELLNLGFDNDLINGEFEKAEEKALILAKKNNFEKQIIMLSLQGEYELANDLFISKYNLIKFPHKLKSYLLVLEQKYQASCLEAKNHFNYILKNSNKYDSKILLESCLLYLQHMHAQGLENEALDFFSEIDLNYHKSLISCQPIISYMHLNRLNSFDFYMFFSRRFHRPLDHNFLMVVQFVLLEREDNISKIIEIVKRRPDICDNNLTQYFIGLLMTRYNLNEEKFNHYPKLAMEKFEHDKKLLLKLNFFDEKFYINKYADVLNGESPIDYYLHSGQFILHSPNAYFDPFYQISQIDTVDYIYSFWDLIVFKFTEAPFKSYRQPSLYLDFRKYVYDNKDITKSNTNILLHKMNNNLKLEG